MFVVVTYEALEPDIVVAVAEIVAVVDAALFVVVVAVASFVVASIWSRKRLFAVDPWYETFLFVGRS